MRQSARLVALAVAGFASVLLTPALSSAQSCAGGWKCGVNYGASTIMDLYVPTKVDASPGIFVAIHYCSGNAGSAHGWVQSQADKYGFIVIAPGAAGNCFDAKPERSGERENITKMVQYVVTQNNADPKRVFAAGASSGACMTQALLAAYPDVFAAGSSLAGVPAGGWTGGNNFGLLSGTKTDAQWGDVVRGADPGFAGTRPRVQLWHGGMDETLKDETWWPPEQGQWKNVFGVMDSDGTKSQFKASQDTWERTEYKKDGKVVVETNFAGNAPHDLSGRGLWDDVVRFFGLDTDAPAGGTGGGGAGGSSSGGSSNGGSSNGGAATGGTAPTAGTSPSAGSPGTAGTASTGGSPSGSGGTSNGTGNTGNTGTGNTGTGNTGNTGTGNTGTGNTGTGAQSSTAGSSSTGTPNSGDSTSDDSGCSIANAGGGSEGALAALLGAGLGAVLWRRRRAAK